VSSRRPIRRATCAFLLLHGAHAAASGQPATLAAGRTLNRTLAFRQADHFQIRARPGEYLHVIVEGEGARIKLVALDPEGKTLADRERVGGNREPINWSAVIAKPGVCRLSVVSRELAGVPVHYAVRLVEVRAATKSDRPRVGAERTVAEGERLERRGNLEAAISRYEEAIQLWKTAGDATGEADAWLHAGQAQFVVGRVREAAAALEQGLQRASAVHDAHAEGLALRSLGKLYGDTGQGPKAVEYLDRALTIAETGQDLPGQAAILAELGSVAGARSENQKARGLFERGLSLAREAGDRKTEADNRNMLGVLYQYLGNNSEALSNFRSALALRRAIGERAGLAQTTTNLGVFHRNLGEARIAVGYYEEALTIRRTLGYVQGIANTLHNLGVAHSDLGEYEQALALFREAADLWRKSGGQRGEMFSVTNLGDVYRRLGDAEKALDHYVRARVLAKLVGDHRGEVAVLVSVGAIYTSQKAFDKSMEVYVEALRLSRDAGYKRETGQVLEAMADVDHARGNSRAAVAKLKDALDLVTAIGDRREESRAMSALGGALVEVGERQQALDALNRALAIQREIGDPDQQALTLSRLARVSQSVGDLSAARDHALGALDVLESVRQRTSSESLRIAFYAFKHPLYQQAIDILMEMHRRDPDEALSAAAFQVAERARARALLDELAERKIVPSRDVNPALAQELTRTLELLDTKAARLDRLLSGSQAEAQAETARREIDELVSHYDHVRAQIRQSSAAYAALTEPRPIGIAEVQQVLRERDMLLEYALGPERSYLWVVSKTTARSVELPSRVAIDKLVTDVYTAVTEPSREIGGETPVTRRVRIERSKREYEQAAAALSAVLLKPVAADLKGHQVFIAADGGLHSLPFASLMPDGADIIVIPSASSLRVLRDSGNRQPPPPNTIALLADPVYSSSGLPRLRLSREEVMRIAALVPGPKKLAVGLAASRATVKSASLGQYSIIHFAAHALVDDERPQLSGIALSQFDARGRPVDGLLRLHDIYNLSLNARLVVLSACRTALGKPTEGEGPIGLARGFLYAGANGVIASLWRVDDRATTVFMTRFYEAMFRRHLPPAVALQAARESMRRDPAWSHPYYWAPFVLIGDSVPLASDRGAYRRTMVQGNDPSSSDRPSRIPARTSS
jgi:CHAT domain-containing protein/Tfp pilus assembly protein PilF